MARASAGGSPPLNVCCEQMSDPTIRLPAFAKVNWTLRVLGKRADGYHEINTVFQTISLHDTISIVTTNEPHIVLSCDDPTVPAGIENIACRAAAALQARLGSNKGAYIRLEKRIPPQAGLAGGSSDAAVTLLALTHLWKARIEAAELLAIAASLGADVPFFFFGGTARGSGLGASVTELPDLPEKFLLVLKPNASVSTSQAYESLNAPSLTTSNAKTILSSSQSSEIFDSFTSEALRNDFETVAVDREPEIKRAKAALIKAGATAALLAGSGSAVFGIFDNKEAQERAIQAIDLEAGWRVFPCATVGRNHYRSAMGPVGEIFARFSGHNPGA